MRISDYLDERCITFLHATTQADALQELVGTLKTAGFLLDPEAFESAIFDRESLVSTGIGMGVAIPHAKLDHFTDFFIAIGIQKNQGIEWNSLDKAPVRLIFMIGGPDNRQNEYLQILSLLTSAIRDPNLRKKLLSAHNAEEVYEVF